MNSGIMNKDNLRLNNFILWCKNWYEPIDKNMNVFDQAKNVLYLDGYHFIRNRHDIMNIILVFMDDLTESKILGDHPFRLQIFYQKTQSNKHWYNMPSDEAFLWAIRDYFAFSITNKDITLNPPVYNRKVYKLGFVGPRRMGNSYKMLNHKANKTFMHQYEIMDYKR